ncbi:hypothetical protein V6952_23480 [Rhizobium laguerreae]
MHASDVEEEGHPSARQTTLQQQTRFDDFISEFNEERPHEALGMRHPADIYRPSNRFYKGLLEIDYPFHDREVLVTNCALGAHLSSYRCSEDIFASVNDLIYQHKIANL